MASFNRIGHICCILVILLSLLCEAKHPHHPGSFVKVQNTFFILNGKPFFFNGFNSYWLMDVAKDPNERHKITEVFRSAAAAGLTVCRTWAFSDGGEWSLQKSPGVYNEYVFQGLDFAISEAHKRGIRLILTLVNNWNGYGGKKQYVQWARDAGEQVENDDDFFTNSVVKEYYKSHAKTVLTRLNNITGIEYKDDPTIMAWELINEPRCQVDYTGRSVHEWVKEMAKYIKSIDKKHLLHIGMEGFYGDSVPEKQRYNPGGYLQGTDFIRSHLVKEIDFASIHVYPELWLPGQNDDKKSAFVQQWMASHWSDSKHTLKKPLVLAEFGNAFPDTANGRNTYLSLVYWNIYSIARISGNVAGSLFWQLMAEDMDSYHDGGSIVLSQDLSEAAVITAQSHKMSALIHEFICSHH